MQTLRHRRYPLNYSEMHENANRELTIREILIGDEKLDGSPLSESCRACRRTHFRDDSPVRARDLRVSATSASLNDETLAAFDFQRHTHRPRSAALARALIRRIYSRQPVPWYN